MYTFSSKEFRQLCIELNRILPKKKDSPLKLIKCDLYTEGICLEVTNLDESLKYSSGSQEELIESFCIHSEAFSLIKTNLRGVCDIRLEKCPNGLKVFFTGSGNSELVFAVKPVDTFPEANTPGKLSEVDLSLFLEHYRGCVPACSKDQMRLSLNGVFYDSREKKLVATSGRMLTMKEFSLPFDFDMIIPSTQTLRLSKVFKEAGAIAECDGHLFLKNGEYLYSVKLLQESYPDYKVVIPEKHTASLQIEQKTLAVRLKELSLMSNSDAVFLLFTGSNAYILSESTTGLQSREISGIIGGNPPEKLSLSKEYFNKAVNAIQEDSLEIRLTEEFAPVVIESDSTKTIIMPMRSSVDVTELQAACNSKGKQDDTRKNQRGNNDGEAKYFNKTSDKKANNSI